MDPPAAPGPRRLVGLLLILVLLLLSPASGHTDAGDHHAHLTITLGGDDPDGDPVPDDRLLHIYAGTLVVKEHAGVAALTVPLPSESDLVRFIVPGHDPEGATETTDDDGANRTAVYTWNDDPPAIGSAIDDVQMIAARDSGDLERAIYVAWPGLDPITELSVMVEAPAGYSLTSGIGLVRQHDSHAPPDRHLWRTSDVQTATLEFTLHPAFTDTDPARAAPPSPLLAWLILLGIALVSATAWFVGKRMERGAAETQDT